MSNREPDPDPNGGLVSMGVPPPVPFWELPAEVQAEAFDSDGNVVVPDYDG
jgi:hypothetical protein